MTVCSVDFETRGTVELQRSGVYPYAKHRDTSPWCLAYAFDDEEPALWDIWSAEPIPERLAAHVVDGHELRAWNAQFERVIWRDCLTRVVVGVPVPRDGQWVCTMAEAMAMALPRSLDHAAQVLALRQQKDMGGNRLSKQMARPRRFDGDAPVWWDDATRREKLYAYCRQDVRVEREAATRLRRLNARERQLYLLDQTINDRGVQLDYPLVVQASEIAVREAHKQSARLAAATGGEVEKTTQVAQLKAWLAGQGVDAPTLAKQALEELLSSGDLSPAVREALDARAEAAKSSVAKLESMLDVAGRDNRLRGLLIYHGASTGRWAGSLVQPHNFPRPSLNPVDIERYIDAVRAGDAEQVVTLKVLSDLLRSMLVAAPGKLLTAVDFATIEVRVLAWVANETTLLQQFQGHRKLYHEMGGTIYGRPWQAIEKPSPEYQIAKNTVLGCGFGMGARKFAKSTGADPELAERAVQAYRTMYPRVPHYWGRLNDAAIAAVANPQSVTTVGHARFTVRGGYLWIVLPAGRSLAYAAPKIVERPMPWDATDVRPAVAFSGVNSYTRKWERMHLYGGLLTENIVSAIARDLLADAMLRTEAAGFPVVLSVHDELVVEHDAGDTAAPPKIFELMKTVPAWADGCPVDAEGWTGTRYRK